MSELLLQNPSKLVLGLGERQNRGKIVLYVEFHNNLSQSIYMTGITLFVK
ncbi:hypothetical protein [Moorena producens]